MSDCTRGLENSDRIALAISQNYFRVKSDNRNAHCLRSPANVRSDLVVLKMHETSVQHTEWNKLIQRFSEAGLITKWARFPPGSTGGSGEIQYKEGVISSTHFIGIACFLCVGLTLAAIAAILEQIIHFKVKQRNHHRYWDVADMFVDGRRHMFIFNGSSTNGNRHRAGYKLHNHTHVGRE